MSKEYAARLQTGAAKKIRLDADIRLMRQQPGSLLQYPGDERCAGGISKAKMQQGLQVQMDIPARQMTGAFAAQQRTHQAQEGAGLGGHPGGKPGRPAAAKPPDA